MLFYTKHLGFRIPVNVSPVLRTRGHRVGQPGRPCFEESDQMILNEKQPRREAASWRVHYHRERVTGAKRDV